MAEDHSKAPNTEISAELHHVQTLLSAWTAGCCSCSTWPRPDQASYPGLSKAC